MKHNITKLTITIIFLFFFQLLYSQYEVSKKISEIFVETNKKEIRKFFGAQDGKTKILVLPFLNNQQKPDEYSDDIARQIASALQLEFQNKNNIMIFVKDEFDGNNTKIIKSFSTTGTNINYYENLLKKFRPDFFIEGQYHISTNSAGQEVLKIEYVNIKNYYYKTTEGIKKKALKSCKSSVPEADKTLNIKTRRFIYANGKATYYEKAEDKSLENLLSKIAASLQTKFLAVKPIDMNISEFTVKVMNTYQYIIADKIKSKVVSEEDGNCEIIKYISKDVLLQIFEEREILIKNYIKTAINAENELRIADKNAIRLG